MLSNIYFQTNHLYVFQREQHLNEFVKGIITGSVEEEINVNNAKIQIKMQFKGYMNLINIQFQYDGFAEAPQYKLFATS